MKNNILIATKHNFRRNEINLRTFTPSSENKRTRRHIFVQISKIQRRDCLCQIPNYYFLRKSELNPGQYLIDSYILHIKQDLLKKPYYFFIYVTFSYCMDSKQKTVYQKCSRKLAVVLKMTIMRL